MEDGTETNYPRNRETKTATAQQMGNHQCGIPGGT